MKRNIHVSKADLHGHTVNSDGELTVLQVIEEAKKQGLDYYAITDHDTLVGADEANALMKSSDLGIHIIYGIELSTYCQGESIHILGYFKDKLPDDAPLREMLKEQIRSRRERAEKMFDLLEKHFNIVLDREEIYRRNSMTRGTMSKMILEKGYPFTSTQIFKDILGNNSPCYLPSVQLETQEGIKAIHDNGGLAVLAHPCLLKVNRPEEIVSMGVDGIEAIYPKTFNEETKYRNMAKKNKLFITAGSDFHRPTDSNHGFIGACKISGQDLKKFLNKLDKIN